MKMVASPPATNQHPRFELAFFVGAEVAVLALLHLSGTYLPDFTWSDPLHWLARTPLLDVLATTARFIGLVLGYWFLSTTVAYTLALKAGAERAVGVLRRFTLPVIRRVAHGVTVASITSVSLVGPLASAGGAETSTPAPFAVVELAQSGNGTTEVDQTTTDTFRPATAGARTRESGFWLLESPVSDTTSTPDRQPTPTNNPPGTTPTQVDAAGAKSEDSGQDTDTTRGNARSTTSGARSHTVAPGDNFWSIAEDHLTSTSAGTVDGAELRRYWLQVIDLNRTSIRSGDPDLIFPGERIRLPAQ